MTNKAEATTISRVADSNETKATTSEGKQAGKKDFVEPEITVPVDVLEATTFFQVTESGGPT